jgi:WD40 repeat protein
LIWNVQTNWRTHIGHRWRGSFDPDEILCQAWSPDGRLLAFTRHGTITVWDVCRNRAKLTIGATMMSDSSLDWSSDKSMLASLGLDGRISIWNPTTGKLRFALDSHGTEPHTIKWSPDGTRLACYGNGHSVIIWNLTRKNQKDARYHILHFDNQFESVQQFIWGHDSRTATTVSADDIVKIWDVEKGKASSLGITKEGCRALEWSSDDRMLAVVGGGGLVEVWRKDGSSVGEFRLVPR